MAVLQRFLFLWKIIFLCTIVLISLTGCGQNVVDYYHSLPQTIFADKDLGNIKYPLSKKGDTWISQSLANYEFAPVVDIKNGYIEFNDEGTGGGNVFIQVVLFKKSDNSPLIGISMGGFNGIYYERSTTFYEKTNNSWIENNDAFPKIEIERFLFRKYKELYFKKDNIITPNLTTLTELPQFGTTVNLNLNFTKYDFLIEANFNPINQQLFTDSEQNKLMEIIDNISVESFQLKFNKAEGKFEITDSTFLNMDSSNRMFKEQDSRDLILDESDIIEKLWGLKTVKTLASYIDSASSQKRELKLLFEGVDVDNPDFYTVRGVEDNGSNYVTHLYFRINIQSFEIYQYDVVIDDFVKIDQ